VVREWRIEADDEWLSLRRTTFFRRHRSRLFGAVANAELGPFGGAPRNPRLKLEDKVYSHVRYVLRGYSYTSVQVDLLGCPRCGYRLLEEHRLVLHRADGAAVTLGRVRMCRRCHREAWLFTSHMPSILAARARQAKVVL
jgi:hypothetical protein